MHQSCVCLAPNMVPTGQGYTGTVLKAVPVTVWGLQFDSAALTVRSCQAWDLGQFNPGTARWDREPFPLSLPELRLRPELERETYVHGTPLQKAASSGPRTLTGSGMRHTEEY